MSGRNACGCTVLLVDLRVRHDVEQQHHDGLCAFVHIDLLHALFHLLVVKGPFRLHVLVGLALATRVMRVPTAALLRHVVVVGTRARQAAATGVQVACLHV
jgi:hypothetical protein